MNEILGSTKKWDYVIMDAWHLGREQVEKDPARASVPPGFPNAVSAFVKEVRAHSPGCKIILFPWWIPRGPKVTNEGAMEVFRSCVEQAEANRHLGGDDRTRLYGSSSGTTGPEDHEKQNGRSSR